MSRIILEGNCFITYEGIASDGHWNPAGATGEDAQGVISEFRKFPADTGLSGQVHREIKEFDIRTLETLDKAAYKDTGYYPQLAWMALERSGLWSAIDEISGENELFRMNGNVDRAGLILPSGAFKMGTELVAKAQEVDWDYQTDECGGHNLLFLYAGNVVSKLYPTFSPRDSGLLVESFVFDPALAE
ncbi:MAG: hypothetical protein AAB436_01105 [Patescibacteria group bacterium]|mgnify:CR=1 FL=1